MGIELLSKLILLLEYHQSISGKKKIQRGMIIFHPYPPLLKHYRRTAELHNTVSEPVKDWPCLTERMQIQFMKWEMSLSGLGLQARY